MAHVRQWIGYLSFVLYVGLLGFVCLEIVGDYLFFRQVGHLIYTNAGRTNNPAVVNAGRPIDVGGVLHPYFGYVQRPGPPAHSMFGFSLTHNADGSICCELPYVPKPNEIVVAILGGSVPEQLAPYLAADDNLLHALSDYLAFRGKTLKILDLAEPGFKQPQSAIVFWYFLSIGQHIDIAVTLDGRNELYVPKENESRKLDYTWPAVWWDVARSLDRLNASSDRGEGINLAYQRWQRLRHSYDAAQCRTGSCYVIDQLIAAYYGSREKALMHHLGDVEHSTSFFGGDSDTHHPVPLYTPSMNELYVEAANFWGRSAENMAALARANDVIYLHFLQPARHFSGPDAGAFDEDDKPIRAGYPIMKQWVLRLRKEGYNVFDATDVFGSTPPEKVYLDECCHFALEGKEIITKRIAAEIGAIYNPP